MKREGIHLEIWFPFGSLTRLKRGGWSAPGALREILSSRQHGARTCDCGIPTKWYCSKCFGRAPAAGDSGNHYSKMHAPPQHTHTHSLYICKSHGGKCVSWGEDRTILNLHTLSRALSGEVQQKNTNNDSVLINLPSCIMQIYSTCIFNGTTTAYTHAGILIYVLTGRRSKYGEFLTNGSHRETPPVEFSH